MDDPDLGPVGCGCSAAILGIACAIGIAICLLGFGIAWWIIRWAWVTSGFGHA